MNNQRKAYIEKLDAQLQERHAQIDLFKARANKAKAEAKMMAPVQAPTRTT